MREKEGKERASDERGKYTGGRERDEKRERQIDICLYILLAYKGLLLSLWVEGGGTPSLG